MRVERRRPRRASAALAGALFALGAAAPYDAASLYTVFALLPHAPRAAFDAATRPDGCGGRVFCRLRRRRLA